MECTFERIAGDELRCKHCSAVVRSLRDPHQVHRRCDLASHAAPAIPLRTPAETARCTHRSRDPIRVDRCDVCGRGGQPFEVFACAVKGECSLNVRHTKVTPCVGCRDWTDSLQPD